MNYYIRPGDLIEVEGRFGVITRVRKATIEYWSRSNPDYPGKLFKVNKDTFYYFIDEGRCVVHLGVARNRRKRKK